MSSTIKKLKKRKIKCTLLNPEEAVIAPENEVFYPTSYGATPDITYTITAENACNVVGADDIGYRIALYVEIVSRAQGTNSGVYASVYINDVAYNIYNGTTYTRIQADLCFCVPCKIGDVIKIYLRCTVANNAALVYYRTAVGLHSIGIYSSANKNRTICITALKVLATQNVLDMVGSAKTVVFDNAYSSALLTTLKQWATTKYENNTGGVTMFTTDSSVGKYIGGLLGAQPRNTSSFSLFGLSPTFYDAQYSTTNVDTQLTLLNIVIPTEMEVEYVIL